MIPTIGLEVHCQLATRTKIFCSCAVTFGSAPNTNVCPVCLGLPGALPVLNREAFRLGLRAVLAAGCEPSRFIKFDRKNYFYPDLPKGYQISQFDAPLGRGGSVEIEAGGRTKRVRLNRIHLEEDAGKLIHDQSPETSHVDLNRAGTPLIEIVSEPDLDSAEEAYEYLTALKATLRAIGVSDCDMEKGQLRCDANVSVRRSAADPLGKKVEIKNLNSFKAVKAAIEHEIERQTKALEAGEAITQETRLWDDAKGRTHPMRSKEEAHDYRYFPEPDLVPFTLNSLEIDETRKNLPMLPRERKERLVSGKDYGKPIAPKSAEILIKDTSKLDLFDQLVKNHGVDPVIAVNTISNSLSASSTALNKTFEEARFNPEYVATIIKWVESGRISHQIANSVMYLELIASGKTPDEILKEKGGEQVSDDTSLKTWIAEAIASNPKVVAEVKGGKDTAVMFLVGQVMKKSQGKANPGKVQEMLRSTLKNS